MARRAPGPGAAGLGAPDPVVHAMAITGIVVTVAATAYAVALARRLYQEERRTDVPDHEESA
jgi:multicomponent Na+:H+ antiporter subunit C